MDFLEVVRLLTALREVDPDIRYHFDGDVLIIRHDIWTVAGTRDKFDQAAKMFESK